MTERIQGERWLAIRRQVIQAQGGVCGDCGLKPIVEVHHLVPLAHGGSNERTNLIGLCRPCHRRRDYNALQARPIVRVGKDGQPLPVQDWRPTAPKPREPTAQRGGS